MANGTIAFDTLTTSDSKKTNTEKSIDTSYIFNGSAKTFFNVDQTSGAVLDGSFNVTSVADNSTGDFTITLTNNLNDANDVAVPIGARNAFVQLHDTFITTSTVEFLSRDTTPSVGDQDLNTGCIHGELA